MHNQYILKNKNEAQFTSPICHQALQVVCERHVYRGRAESSVVAVVRPASRAWGLERTSVVYKTTRHHADTLECQDHKTSSQKTRQKRANRRHTMTRLRTADACHEMLLHWRE